MTKAGDRPDGLAWILLVVLSLIWGSSFILMKRGLEAFSPVEMAAIRLSVAMICLIPFLIKYLKRINFRQFGLYLIIGLTGNGIPAFLFAKAETVIPSSIAGVLNSLSPLFTLIVATLFWKRKFSRKAIYGIMLGLAGAVILSAAKSEETDSQTNLIFSLLIVLATIFYSISANLIKEKVSHQPPLMVTTLAVCSVGIPAIIYLFSGTDFIGKLETHPEGWSSFGYIAVLGALGTAFAVVLFNRMLQITSILFASSVTYTIPIIALILGIYDGESLNIFHIAGISIVISGVYLVNKK